MRIIFLGLPGSGKGTQARWLARHLNLPFLGMGDMLRALATRHTPVAKRVRDVLAKGNAFVEDAMVVDLFLEELRDASGFVAEGLPRSASQKKLFLEKLATRDMKIDHTFYLDLSVEEAAKRLARRVVCLACGEPYTQDNTLEDSCGACGEKKLGKRHDDGTKEVIESRLQICFEREVELVRTYENDASFHRVNALPKVEVVRKDILNCMGMDEGFKSVRK